MVDTDRIWFKSHYGLSVNQIDREPGLCASAILGSDTYIIGDACADARTLSNPLVAGEFGLRFYAAVPLQTEDECNLGTLCIIDKVPRTLTADEQLILKQLADIVIDEMEMRLALRKTVTDVKKLSSDIGFHLNETINNLQIANAKDQKEAIANYLDASRVFLLNIENRLDQL
jgi:GAF domain-containing protein